MCSRRVACCFPSDVVSEMSLSGLVEPCYVWLLLETSFERSDRASQKTARLARAGLETDISFGLFVYCLGCAGYADEFASGCEE